MPSTPAPAHDLTDAEVQVLRERNFPGLNRYAYFDTSSIGVLPLTTFRAATAALEESVNCEWSFDEELARREALRSAAAQVMNCHADDLALLGSTGQGLNLIASGLRWQAGDEVLVSEDEFPTGILAWTRLRERGVLVRFVKPTGQPGLTVRDFENVITSRTRLLSVSSVNFQLGYRSPIEELAQLCRTQRIVLVVDAMQSFGAHPIDVAGLGADVVAAGSSKYLLGGTGGGACYVSRELRDQLEVSTAGWLSLDSVRDPSKGFVGDLPFAETSRRYEGSAAPEGVVAATMLASAQMLLGVGTDRISRRINILTELIAARIQKVAGNASIYQSPGSPIVSVGFPGKDAAELVPQLRNLNVICSSRARRLRISAHFYNTADDVDALTSGIERLSKENRSAEVHGSARRKSGRPLDATLFTTGELA